MKKIASLFMALALAFSLASCGSSSSGVSDSGKDDSIGSGSTSPSGGETTLHALSHTYAALEYYAGELKEKAPDGVSVDVEMTNYTDWQEKMRLNLSSQAASYDITYITPQDIAEFAANGWLEPLDEYVEKYWDQYNFADIPQYLWDAYSYDGHIYGIPSHQWAMVLFYRTDLFEDAGLAVPQTLDEMVNAASKLKTDKRSGITLTLKASDMLMVTYQSFLTACNGWFWDADYNPTFSSAESLKAIEYMQKLYDYAPADSSSYTNNEATVAMGQDLAAMAMLQTTRSSSMSDPSQSNVIGLVDFASAPSQVAGGTSAAIWNTAGYSISKFSKNDIETSFHVIAAATDADSSAGGVESGMPCRTSVLSDELLDTRPDYDAAWKAILSGATLRPTIPEFNEIMVTSMTALSSVLTGQTDAVTAMAKVDEEVRAIFQEAGYYK